MAGASAGGLEAFTAFLKSIPADTGMSFVLIQHLEPNHESMLASLLSNATKMPVREVSDGLAVEPNHVYVIPPNKSMTIRGGILRLAPRSEARAPHNPIDNFAMTLAEENRSGAIGIVLSGTGSDGTLGLKAIKEQGGITFAQDPKSAQWAAMPMSAISAGSVDFVLPPKRIAAELARIGRHPYLAKPLETPMGGDLQKICLILRSVTGVDFRLYKPATFSRRVARRMALQKMGSLGRYAQFLRQHPAEAEALADDIFIHVTEFFRDPVCFQSLGKLALPSLLRNGAAGEPIRIWVPGCSTGEEVYSIAMLLLEGLGDQASRTRIQIFGTDISEGAIGVARAGVYSDAALSGVSRARLKTFFVKVDSGHQINKAVRDLCVFARHDLANDPPFSNLDLISCRNVLIYMGPALQKRTLSIFQYALRPGGFLFLGKSESLSAFSDVFAPKDEKHRIFLRRPLPPGGRRLDSISGHIEGPSAVVRKTIAAAPAFDYSKEAERLLLNRYAPPALIIDANLHIVHFQGDTSPFLAPSPGQPSFHVLRIIRPEFVVDLRAALQKARKEGVTVRGSDIRFEHNGEVRTVRLEVTPIKERTGKEYRFLAVFQKVPEAVPEGLGRPAAARGPGKAASAKLERELAAAREYLRSLIADHEAAEEEMTASNEEILSSNEELQSTNEELETAKEELQSTNEELATTNEELRHRNAELGILNDDLGNLLTGVNIPIVILDSGLRIRRFTPMAEKMLNLIATDVGRPFSHISSNLKVADLDELLSDVLGNLRTVEQEVQDRDGRWYTLRIRPYKTGDNKISGALLALFDIDAVKRSLDQVRQSRNYAESIIGMVQESLLVLDSKLRVSAANPSFYSKFQVKPEETIGRLVFDLGNGQWNIPQFRRLLLEVLPKRTQMEHFVIDHEFPSIGRRQMAIGARQIPREGEEASTILLVIEDVTELSEAEQAARESASTTLAVLESASQAILAVDREAGIRIVNAMAETMFGYDRKELLGQPLEILVPQRLAEVHAAHREEYFESPRARPMGVGMTLAGRRKDGSEFPIEVSLSFIQTKQGNLTVAFVSDITDRVKSEEAVRQYQRELETMTARLIASQEAESKQLARDLHDVFSQRLAVFAMDIATLAQRPPKSPALLREQLKKLEEQTKSLATGIHQISRQLHPAILDDLGLVVALKNECIAFSEIAGVPAIFDAEDVPSSLPEDVSLCLYRVAQESLRNIGKHSKASEARVHLQGGPEEIALTIQDIGGGFDLNEVRRRKGLGLVSMEERVRLARGRFAIESRVGEGTRVEVRIPLKRSGS